MRRRLLGPILTVVVSTLASHGALACLVCDGETGRLVQAGVFDEGFVGNLLGVLAPFAVFAGVVAAIHFGPPRRRAGEAKP